ncbi:MAG TPA: YncE family protein [Blastocatellia bacterium]|nr:YncE family protein [Blastocatellia bacterium]
MRRYSFGASILVAIVAVLLTVCLHLARAERYNGGPANGFHLIHQYKLGGEGFWDYLTLDSKARRLYISRGTRVVVMNVDNGSVVGEVPDTNGVHGIALATKLGRGFASDGRDGKVTIFDLKTLKVLGEAKTGQNPDAIIYDDATKRVFTFNGRSSDSTAIDAASGSVAGTIPLGGRPEFAAADGRGNVYVNLEDKSKVVQLDSKNLSVKATWPLAPGESPSGMAIDRKHKRLFIGCHNQMMVVMDATNGHVVATPAIGQGVDANAFDPGTKLAFSSNGDGTLTVVHEDSGEKFSVVENAATQRGARTMAVDLKTHHVFVVTAEFGAPAAATAQNPHPRPAMLPGSFTVLEYGR